MSLGRGVAGDVGDEGELDGSIDTVGRESSKGAADVHGFSVGLILNEDESIDSEEATTSTSESLLARSVGSSARSAGHCRVHRFCIEDRRNH